MSYLFWVKLAIGVKNKFSVCSYPPGWVLCQKLPLYTCTTDKLMADFHCLGLNKVLKSRANPVSLKSLT